VGVHTGRWVRQCATQLFILLVSHVGVSWYLRLWDAAVTVEREGVSMEAAADDTLAS
jgi:hypothetical protein